MRWNDDARRFAYGELTFALWDRMIQLARADHGEPGIDVPRVLADADTLAARLASITDLVQSAGSHANAKNALEATHMASTLAWFHHRFAH
jgi:hypothetical protein